MKISGIVVRIICLILAIICFIYIVDFFIVSNQMLANGVISHYRSNETLYLSMKAKAKLEICMFFAMCLLVSFLVSGLRKKYEYPIFFMTILIILAFIVHTFLIFQWIYGGVKTPMAQSLNGTILSLIFVFLSFLFLVASCVIMLTTKPKKD